MNELISKAKMLSGLKTKQAVLNQALQFYIEHLELNGTNKKQSFYKFTEHLAGSIEGPSDLAHNKVYMQDFGK